MTKQNKQKKKVGPKKEEEEAYRWPRASNSFAMISSMSIVFVTGFQELHTQQRVEKFDFDQRPIVSQRERKKKKLSSWRSRIFVFFVRSFYLSDGSISTFVTESSVDDKIDLNKLLISNRS